MTARLTGNPALVNDTAKAPPKKDDRQSALQVAIKSAHPDIALLLIERGADIPFRETSAINSWNMPVLHDAIMAAVFSSRFARNYGLPGKPPNIEIFDKPALREAHYTVLDLLLTCGADPNSVDSYGSTALNRAALDASEIIEDPPLNSELAVDLHRVFDRLLAAGADRDWVDTRYGRSLRETYAARPVGKFFRFTEPN